jgi:hypothetical protein
VSAVVGAAGAVGVVGAVVAGAEGSGVGRGVVVVAGVVGPPAGGPAVVAWTL